jgi:hypothetical protein
LQANQQHGLRRSGADKRHAIKLLLADEELCCWSDRRIAEFLDVDGKTVASVRTDLEFAGEVKPQPVRKSVSGAEVTAKKSAPVAPSPALEFGSTQKDQRKTFNDVALIELKLREDSAAIREFTLGKITSKTNEGDMTGEARITLMPERFIYNWQAKTRGHGGPLQAKSWTGAVIELLGMYGIVSPDLVITWASTDGQSIPCPDIQAAEANTQTTPAIPEPEDQTSETLARVEALIDGAQKALTALRQGCSAREIFDTLEAHPGLANKYRDLHWDANRVAVDMSDALARDQLEVT